MAEHWYQNALIYCLDVKTFADGNGDGIGDFVGLREKLSYLAGLNIDCVWLQPFFPSPMRDNGYDITDYYNVDPRFGTLGDFVEFARSARNKGLRVMIDLVVNHTSIDHPWFQAARSDPHSPFRDYYVWSDTKPEDAAEGTVFPGEQNTTWTWDREAKAYYFHRFYDHQAELNIANPAVRREIEKITGYWLQLGVTGFRIDALPFLIELKNLPTEGQADPHDYLRELRQHAQTLCGDVCLMAEANLPPEDVPDYFGHGDKIHMSFNFWLNQHLFLALARQNARPVREAWEQLPPLPEGCQWNNFLRSHDEADFGRLTPPQLQEVFRAFGPDPDMQLYDRGIRRRLAPMLGNDRRHMELAYSLQFSLRGTPVLRYGEEIGMGEDLSLDGRDAIRTPMQWSYADNAGFSTAEPEKLVRPVIDKGEYGYQNVNVTAQRKDPRSLLGWFERMIRTLREAPETGSGSTTHIDVPMPPGVLAHRADGRTGTMVFLHNIGTEDVEVDLNTLAPEADLPIDVLSDRNYEDVGKLDRLKLGGYGYRWIRLCRGHER